MDIQSKPTFIPHGHHLLFVSLLVSLSAYWLAFLPLTHAVLVISILLVRFTSFCYYLRIFPSIACLLVSCICLSMYAHGARTLRARARSPKSKQKGQGCEHANMNQVVVVVSWFRV